MDYNFPASKQLLVRQNKWIKKSSWLRQKEKSIRHFVEPYQCSRTTPFFLSTGMIDWHEWCQCEDKCFKHWSFHWLFHLKTAFALKTNEGKERYLQTCIDWNIEFANYNIWTNNKQLIPVCKNFFCRVFGIGNSTINNYIKRWKEEIQDLTINKKDNRGIWNRAEDWKGKVDTNTVKQFFAQVIFN